MLRIIKDMYNEVKTCVRGCDSYSDFFECQFEEFFLSLKLCVSCLMLLWALYLATLVRYRGLEKCKEIERIHLKLCKYLLKVKSSTCNI